MKYRKEIDGLRAIAVLPVIFFHAGVPGFAGGYVGVDVFFIISGYLITALIMQDIDKGQFGFLNFYERRARRILPALLFVTLVSIPFAWALMMPNAFEDFSSSVASVGMFVSNFYFWSETGYFDTAIGLKPLIHTWSLAVEEQYYLLVPLLIVTSSRLGRRSIGWLLWIVFWLSLALSIYGSTAFPDANFFLLPSRGWELMVGGLLAYYERSDESANRNWIASVLGLVGVVCIAVSIAVFGEHTRHPGLLTLLPVAGTALVILYGRVEGIANRLLSLRITVGIGLISYSLYLWHQPVFVFARLYTSEFLSASDYVPLILLSFTLSVISWKYVEAPFRSRTIVPATKLWALTGAALIFVTAIGLAGSFGMLQPNVGPILENATRTARSQPNKLFIKNGIACQNRPPESACVLGKQGQPITWALVGDSDAGTLGSSLDEMLRRSGLAGVQLTGKGCPYAIGLVRFDDAGCLEWNRLIRKRIDRGDIEIVVLAGRYVLQMEKTRFDNGEGGREHGKSAGYTVPHQDLSDEARRVAVAASYRSTIEDLLTKGKKVILVYPIPEVGWNVPKKIFHEYKNGNYELVTTDSEVFRRRSEAVFAVFDSISDSPSLLRIYPHKLFCDNAVSDRCITSDGDSIYYSDANHLSFEGADLLIADIEENATRRWGAVPTSIKESRSPDSAARAKATATPP